MTTAIETAYETVIGVEVHVQLSTESKLFCGDSTQFGEEPNVNTSPVTLGLPGVLPVLNKKAVNYAIKLGLALNCEIPEVSKFDRKQYFYPDLPKGYQISQFDMPVCLNGAMTLSNGRKIRINRAHLEEDAGKLVHAGAEGLAGSSYSLVDLNRAGMPLLEIVSEPDFRSGEEVREYMSELQKIVRYLGVCDGNLEEGSMRCDANVSIRPVGSDVLNTKAEIKNMNSFKAVQKAIESEVVRQIDVVESGGKVVQETRLWNEATESTISMRSKEEAHDYRYFPDPDLRPLFVSRDWVESIQNELPELPSARLERFINDYEMSEYDAGILVEFKELGDFFDAASQKTKNHKAVINLLMGDITAYLKQENISLSDTQLIPEMLCEVIELVDSNTIGSAGVKKILPDLLKDGGSPKTLVEEKGLVQVSDEDSLKPMIDEILANNEKQVAQYKEGNEKVMGFFVGQVMRASKGSANPQVVNKLLKEALDKL